MFSLSFSVVELGGVDADDDDLIGVFLFQLGQVGQRVDAVDAAERPEIEDDDLAAQVLELDGMAVLSQPTPPSSSGAGWRCLRGGRRRFVVGRQGRPPAAARRCAGWPPRKHTSRQGPRREEEREGAKGRRRRSRARTGAGGIGASDISSLLHKGRAMSVPERFVAPPIVFYGRQTRNRSLAYDPSIDEGRAAGIQRIGCRLAAPKGSASETLPSGHG